MAKDISRLRQPKLVPTIQKHTSDRYFQFQRRFLQDAIKGIQERRESHDAHIAAHFLLKLGSSKSFPMPNFRYSFQSQINLAEAFQPPLLV